MDRTGWDARRVGFAAFGEERWGRAMERNSRKLIRMLEQDGWVLDRVSGDHHTFKHPKRNMIITVTHPRRDLPTGLVRRIYKLAGWRS